MIRLSSKYEPLFTSDSRYFVITGGRGSAKSFSTSFFLLMLSFERGHTILFTRYTMTAANISIIPEFIDKIEKSELQDSFYITKDSIINKVSGSKILFKGLKTSSGDQTANLKSLEGVTTWVLDEAEELNDEDVFDKIDLSVRNQEQQNRVILILNPTTKEHFIYKRWFEEVGVEPGSNVTRSNTTYIHTTYLDCIEHLSESFVAQIERMRVHRPDKYKHQILGGWRNRAEGVVFENWKLGEFPNDKQIVYGQDYGFSKDPTTLVGTYIDKANNKIYLKEFVYLPNLSTSQVADLNLKHAGKALIVGDNAEPRLIAELKAKGCNVVACNKWKVNERLALMQDFELIIDPESVNLIKELNNYSWLEKKSETPIDAWNHALDGAGYAVTYQLENPHRGKYYVY